jgi:hypothetical protein
MINLFAFPSSKLLILIISLDTPDHFEMPTWWSQPEFNGDITPEELVYLVEGIVNLLFVHSVESDSS